MEIAKTVENLELENELVNREENKLGIVEVEVNCDKNNNTVPCAAFTPFLSKTLEKYFTTYYFQCGKHNALYIV